MRLVPSTHNASFPSPFILYVRGGVKVVKSWSSLRTLRVGNSAVMTGSLPTSLSGPIQLELVAGGGRLSTILCIVLRASEW